MHEEPSVWLAATVGSELQTHERVKALLRIPHSYPDTPPLLYRYRFPAIKTN